MFENKKIRGIHISRIIMSWVRVGGKLGKRGDGCDQFREWLRAIGLTESEIADIIILATNGKMELENSAKVFLKMKENQQ